MVFLNCIAILGIIGVGKIQFNRPLCLSGVIYLAGKIRGETVYYPLESEIFFMQLS